MAPKTATDLKAEGNEQFKAGRHAQAAALFAKAELLDPTDPVYPSNLSAALYENGQYTDAIQAILRSWLLLRANTTLKPELATRLFTRLGKALAQGIAGQQVGSAFLQETQLGIESLAHAVMKHALSSPEDAALLESVRAWPDLLEIHRQVDGRDEVVKEWLGRFSLISMIKKPPTSGLNYWAMGMDDVSSMLRGWDGHPHQMDLKTIPLDRLSKLSFLYAGVGDGRHVYTTIVDLHASYKKLSKERKDAMFLHITMLDLHPAMLARDMVILMLASQLGDDGIEEEDRLEIQAAAVYLWNGVALPSYCAERVRNVMQDLRDRMTDSPPRLPKWLIVAPESHAGILQHIMSWLTVRPEPVGPILDRHEYKNMQASLFASIKDPSMPASYRQLALKSFGDTRKRISDGLRKWSISEKKKYGMIDEDMPMAEAKRMSKELHEKWVDVLLESEMTGGTEDLWYGTMKVFLPPAALRVKHPGFDELILGFGYKKSIDQKLKRKVEKSIRASWETNRTYFAIDPKTKHSEQGYTDDTSTSMSSMKCIYDIVNDVVPGGYPDQGFGSVNYYFSLTMTYFDLLGKAIKCLEGHLRVESLAGDMLGEMAKMWFQNDASRPAAYPRKFTRAWLSNVPDYVGGPLNTAIYIVPQTDGSPEVGVSSNSFAATSAFRVLPDFDNEFCHTYTLLPFRELPRYLGCKAASQSAVFKCLTLVGLPLPRPLTELASRTELTTWLTRLLVNILIPGRSQDNPNRITLPNNLAAFLGLLIHLHRVGFPGHWLSDYLHVVLSGGMVTDIAPYEEKWPILLKDGKRRVKARKVRFDPWLGDFENILAVSHEGLPFALTLPPSFARTPDEIGVYSATVEMNMPLLSNAMHTRDPNMTLVFYKRQMGMNEHWLMTRIPDILNDIPWTPEHKCPAPGEIVILTAVEAFEREGGQYDGTRDEAGVLNNMEYRIVMKFIVAKKRCCVSKMYYKMSQ
ncbi:hypothetical protein EUX98_g6912 [Antrodiella citrinella]|uniref:DUF4470 domain-containing protein n=1 Tax=Antrodiella citrinella TaxID=2447956 RepID=A0A4S4MMU5_9APHY|nr:hypothetical protein EUX98_g6912 [Antrodiella citrinella]